jgi:hypothetical protein
MIPHPEYPKLVQHLHHKEDLTDTYQPWRYTDIRPGNTFGVASLFEFAYMGRAEYERGAIPTAREALTRIMDSSCWPDPVELKCGDFSCWFVGPPTARPIAQVFFETELGDTKAPYTKEYTDLRESYVNPKYQSPDGWWVLLPLPGFGIFKTREGADLFQKAIREAK